MEITIRATSKRKLDEILESILNMATIMVTRGIIPSPHEMTTDMEERARMGRWWYREPNSNRFQLYGIANNHWAHIKEETDTSFIIDFNIRYDHNREQEYAICNAIIAFFGDNVEKAS